MAPDLDVVYTKVLAPEVSKHPNRAFFCLYRLVETFPQFQFYVEQLLVYTMSD